MTSCMLLLLASSTACGQRDVFILGDTVNFGAEMTIEERSLSDSWHEGRRVSRVKALFNPVACTIRSSADKSFLVRATMNEPGVAQDNVVHIWKIDTNTGAAKEMETVAPNGFYGTFVVIEGMVVSLYCFMKNGSWMKSTEPFEKGWARASKLPLSLETAVTEWKEHDVRYFFPPVFSSSVIALNQSYGFNQELASVPICHEGNVVARLQKRQNGDGNAGQITLGEKSIGLPGGWTLFDCNVVNGAVYVSMQLPYLGGSIVDHPSIPEFRARIFRLEETGPRLKWVPVAPGYSIAG